MDSMLLLFKCGEVYKVDMSINISLVSSCSWYKYHDFPKAVCAALWCQPSPAAADAVPIRSKTGLFASFLNTKLFPSVLCTVDCKSKWAIECILSFLADAMRF